MRGRWLAPVALALTLAEASGTRAAGLRSTGAARKAAAPGDDPPAACSCDCCLTQREAPVPGAASAVACAPRAGAGVAGGAAGTGDGGCARLCQVPDEDKGSFESLLGAVDYVRYCSARCRPASLALGMLCVDGAAGAADGLQLVAGAGPPRPARALPQVERRTQAEDEGSAMVALARGEMERARSEAEAAGKAAYLARDSYERVLASSRAQGKAAARSALAKLRRRAREQAWDAKRLRQGYEERVRKRAKKAALKAAMVYKTAKARELRSAALWRKRARQFEEAAREREEFAVRAAEDAQRYRQSQASDLERRYTLEAQQALDEADAYGDSAEAAEAQAKNITSGAEWYDKAERYAAARALAAAIPPGVPLPELPALP